MFGHGTAKELSAPPVSMNLIEEINHRVANEYAEAIASLSLAASRAGDDEVKVTLARVANRLRDHADSHRVLIPPSTDSTANLADYIGRICQAYSKATLAERGVLLALDMADVELPADRCWRIGLVLTELIRNAARHGLLGGGGKISVRIAQSSGQLICAVSDTGQRPTHSIPGRGQHVIRSLVADLGGSVEWSFTSTGSFAVMRIPDPHQATVRSEHMAQLQA